MRILVCSYAFHPSVGGIETVVQLLCQEWVRMGHQVSVITHSKGAPVWQGIYVYRRPAFGQLLRLLRTCDVYWQNNISLSYLAPLLFVPRPWFTTAHLWPSLTNSIWSPRPILKHCVQLFTRNIYISKAVSSHHLWPGVVIPNPVDVDRWKSSGGSSRVRDIVFVGRLVEGKGCALLIDALALLYLKNQCPTVTIIGCGPQMPDLQHLVYSYNLHGLIRFTGVLQGQALVNEVCEHRLAVIPSTWEEPFGVVVLEAIAAGCVPLFSSMGGLPEASGPCGFRISSLTPQGLAASISTSLLAYDELKASLDHLSPDHLALHSVSRIAASYIHEFKNVCE